jgi:flavodoxin I
MQAIVVYDTTFGNTEQIAQAIAGGVGSTAAVRLTRVSDISTSELQGAGLVIVGSPTQGGRPTTEVLVFLNAISRGALKEVRVAAFDTRISLEESRRGIRILAGLLGYAAGRISRKLKKAGGTEVAPPEGFIVTGREGPLAEGELERAAAWAKSLIGTD